MKRIVAAISAVALIGCSSVQKKPDAASDARKNEESTSQTGTGGRAALGAVGGAGAGAVMCLSLIPASLGVPGFAALAALVCLPVGVVGGAVVGGVVGATRSPTAQSPTTTAFSTPSEVAASPYRTEGRFVLVASGQVEHGDAVPSGELYVAMNTIALGEGNHKRASLVINFLAASAEGGRSLVAQTAISCDTGAASIHHSFTYGEANGDGTLVKAEEHTSPKVLNEPSAAFSSAVRTVCEAGPWWNTPAHLYAK